MPIPTSFSAPAPSPRTSIAASWSGRMDLLRRPNSCRSFVAALALGVLACLAASSRAAGADTEPPRTAAATHTLVFFGDSLTAGYGLDDPATESYPAVIEQRIEAAHLPWRVVNAGESGETSAGGRRRVEWVLRQPTDVFVLELGANDGLRGTDPAVTRANLQAIIDEVRAKAPAATLVLAGMQMPTSMGADYARAFGAVFSTLAATNHIRLIPFLLAGVGGHPELNQADGIHPTAVGAQRVADNVWTVLRPLLGPAPNDAAYEAR